MASVFNRPIAPDPRSPLNAVVALGADLTLSPQALTLGDLSVRWPGHLGRPSIFPGGRFPKRGPGQVLIEDPRGTCLYRDRRLEDHGEDRYYINSRAAGTVTLRGLEAQWFRDTLRAWAPGDTQ